MGVSTPEKKLQRSKPNLNQNLKISKWVLISNPKKTKTSEDSKRTRTDTRTPTYSHNH